MSGAPHNPGSAQSETPVEAATENAQDAPVPQPRRQPAALAALLAGLQAGMLGACWMLVWLGVSSAWQRRSFWTAANLMATLFYGDRAIRDGFARSTLSGVAVYILLYSTLGALFALALRSRLPRLRLFLVSVAFALAWYYVSFTLLWKAAIPLVTLLHSAQPMILGHLVFGACLGRYPVYLVAFNKGSSGAGTNAHTGG
jgi:hypothetical protein